MNAWSVEERGAAASQAKAPQNPPTTEVLLKSTIELVGMRDLDTVQYN